MSEGFCFFGCHAISPAMRISNPGTVAQDTNPGVFILDGYMPGGLVYVDGRVIMWLR